MDSEEKKGVDKSYTEAALTCVLEEYDAYLAAVGGVGPSVDLK